MPYLDPTTGKPVLNPKFGFGIEYGARRPSPGMPGMAPASAPTPVVQPQPYRSPGQYGGARLGFSGGLGGFNRQQGVGIGSGFGSFGRRQQRPFSGFQQSWGRGGFTGGA